MLAATGNIKFKHVKRPQCAASLSMSSAVILPTLMKHVTTFEILKLVARGIINGSADKACSRMLRKKRIAAS